MSENPKIAPLVGSILFAFKKLIANLNASNEPHASTASSCLGRFKLWSASSGAHLHRGTRSLEYKLEDASTLHGHVTSLLKELRDVVTKSSEASNSPADRSPAEALNIQKCNETFDDELAEYFSENDNQDVSVFDELLNDIQHVIDRLLRLSVIIRNPTSHDYFLSRQAAAFIQSFEPFDIGHVREKFPELPEELVERLGRSQSLRRQYFRYREERFMHLIEEGLETDVEVAQSNIVQSVPAMPLTSPQHQEEHNLFLPAATESEDIFFNDTENTSQHSATLYTASTSCFDNTDNMSQMSATNYTAPGSCRDDSDRITEVSMGSHVDWELVRQNAVDFNRTSDIPDMSVASNMAYQFFTSNKFRTIRHTLKYAESFETINSYGYLNAECHLVLMRVPPIPDDFDQGPAKCPFCHSIISLDTRSDWKQHVFRDLRPYICLSNTCRSPNKLYGRRSEWGEHMRLEHWRLWKCPFGCEEGMHTAEEFQQHILSTHKDEVSQHHTSDLAHLCSVLDPSKARGHCLFCNHELTSERLYISHMALHLEQLALFVLPSIEYDEYDSDERGDEGDTDDSSQDLEEKLTNENVETGERSNGDESSDYLTKRDQHIDLTERESSFPGSVGLGGGILEEYHLSYRNRMGDHENDENSEGDDGDNSRQHPDPDALGN